MAGKRKPGPLGGQTNAGNADEGGRVNPTTAGPAPSTASSVFAKALGSMESEAGAVLARLRVKAENLDRGIRNNLDGAFCIYAAGVQAENYAPEAILEETGCQISTLISGILPGLMEMLKVVGATTVFGAGIGGAVGLFAGGATAAPGLVIGGELGFDIGMAALTWLGLGFLVATITEGFVELYKSLHEGVEWAWQAKDMKGAAQKEQQDRAAHKMAEAAGILMRLVLQGILAELLRKAAMGTTRGALATGKAFEAQGARATADAGVAEVVGKLRASKFGNGFSDWIEKNWRDLQKNPKLQPRAAASPSQAPAAAAEGGGSGGGGGKAASSAARRLGKRGGGGEAGPFDEREEGSIWRGQSRCLYEAEGVQEAEPTRCSSGRSTQREWDRRGLRKLESTAEVCDRRSEVRQFSARQNPGRHADE